MSAFPFPFPNPPAARQAIERVRRAWTGTCETACGPILDELEALPVDERRAIVHELLSMATAWGAVAAGNLGVTLGAYLEQLDHDLGAGQN